MPHKGFLCACMCAAADENSAAPMFACNLKAISAVGRPRYNDLVKRIRRPPGVGTRFFLRPGLHHQSFMQRSCPMKARRNGLRADSELCVSELNERIGLFCWPVVSR